MLVMGISPEAAFLAGVAPFVVVDVLKILAAVACARAVKAAVRECPFRARLGCVL